jgi:hypothetical protein
MSLDGLRAWIGEVERKLGMRTRVFLVLATIAIGGAGAAIYLAIDTRDNAVSESDVRELQERLETQIAAGATSAATPPAQSAEPPEPEPEPEPEEPGAGSKPSNGGEGAGAVTGSGGSAQENSSNAKLQDLLEQAKKENEAAEAEQNEK